MTNEFRATRFHHNVLELSLYNRHMNYKEKCWELMDTYLEKYQHNLPDDHNEISTQSRIRAWLVAKDRWKELGGEISKALEEWYIRYMLGLEDYRKDYLEVINNISFPMPGVNDSLKEEIVKN